jgi:hypothetical protein
MQRRQWKVGLLSGIVLAATAQFGPGTVAAQENVNPGFTFDGIDAFWEVVAVLESDTEPTADQWEDFFQSPGYKRLSEEFGRGYFTDAIRAVFLPSETGLADEMVRHYAEGGGFLGWYTPRVLEGFREASRDRDWQSRRVQELRTYPYLEKAAEYALQYLPEDSADAYPAVDFVVFNDSRGYNPIIIGITGNDAPPSDQLACLRRQGLDRHFPFTLLMAHESFHMYRDAVDAIEFPEEGQPDYPVLWTLDQMVNEGIGDLINRKRLFYGDGCLAGSEEAIRLHHEQQAQPATIRIMDHILSEMSDAPELTDVLGRQLQSLIPQSGHPTGFYMANLIEEELGTAALKQVVRDPFGFFALYNRAAEANGRAPGLSDRTMAYLGSLRGRYRKQ